jgi:SAM-dependent methyltransferase
MTAPAPDPANLFVFQPVQESTPEFDISDPEVVRMLEESQRTHFWFRARNRRILDFLRRDGLAPPARILEIGCGTGTVLTALSGAGYETTGVEMHRELARRAAIRNPTSRIYSFDLSSPPLEFLREERFDAVVLFDVLEHLAEPEALLRSCGGELRPGGLLAGTVPSLSILWSDYDRFAGHRLRYDRRTLQAVFARAGLPPPRTGYFFQALVPALFARRLMIGRRGASDEEKRRAAQHLALDAPRPGLNRALESVCAIEGTLSRFLPLDRWPGASLWFSSRVPDPDAFKAEMPPRERTGDKR